MEHINPTLIPQRKLSNGMIIPALGMGTFGNDKFEPEQVSQAVAGAIKAGYRLFDCAAAYQNEKEIGKVFADAFANGIVQREDLTIMSKVWNDMHGQGDVLVACAQTLRDLQLDYLDAYMVHWPFPTYHAPGAHLEEYNPLAVPFSTEEFMSVWRQMEKLQEMGLVKTIGMSNMTVSKLEKVLPLCRIKPTVLEVEMNPTFQQPRLFEYCEQHNIQLIAYGPMGGPIRPVRDTTPYDLKTFEMPEIVEIAKAHNCHPAIICVKWAVQRGQIPIPFSIYENEYVGNLKCVTEDFLTDEEMETIRKADKNFRLYKGMVFMWKGSKWEDIWDNEDDKNLPYIER